ncbi:MAG: Rrf2 family transcriptional regulator [Sedimentisphaerales bacterium]|nr:Rrf2 family transcriptional regulator [Sedimentisphaerales bacterium]
MDVIRRNTDYALRALVHLGRAYGKSSSHVSSREIAAEEDISYQLACKLLQKMQKAGFVESSMGPFGGFRLKRAPGTISLLDVVEAIQGPLSLNRCLVGRNVCSHEGKCPIRPKLAGLQEYMGDYLRGVTLDSVIEGDEAAGDTTGKSQERRKR